MANVSNGIDDIKVGDIKVLALRLLLHHGPWALLAIFLIAAQFGWISSPQSKKLDDLEKVILDNRAVIISTNRQMQVDHGYQNVLLRVLCRNSLVLQQQGTCEPKYYGYEESSNDNGGKSK